MTAPIFLSFSRVNSPPSCGKALKLKVVSLVPVGNSRCEIRSSCRNMLQIHVSDSESSALV